MSKKRLFGVCQRLARGSEQRVKSGVAHEQLVDMGYGEIREGYFYISQSQREGIRSFLKTEFGYDWLNKNDPTKQQTRLDAAKHGIQEKFNQLPSKSKWTKLLPLDNSILINNELIPNYSFMHLEMSIDDLSSIDCQHLLLVENIEAFSAIRAVNITIPSSTLVIYRGDTQSESGVKFIKKARKLNKLIKVGVYADFDPAGLEIALSITPDLIIMPCISSLSIIKGDKQGYIKQFHQIKSSYPAILGIHIDSLKELKASYTQERLIAHNIKHEIIWLGEG